MKRIISFVNVSFNILLLLLSIKVDASQSYFVIPLLLIYKNVFYISENTYFNVNNGLKSENNEQYARYYYP